MIFISFFDLGGPFIDHILLRVVPLLHLIGDVVLISIHGVGFQMPLRVDVLHGAIGSLHVLDLRVQAQDLVVHTHILPSNLRPFEPGVLGL